MKYKVITAIICISILEGIALWKGIDGALAVLASAAIASLGTYSVGRYHRRK